jgi:hypothetical protein
MKYVMTYESFEYEEIKQLVDKAYVAFKEKDEELFNDPRSEDYGNPFTICTNGAKWVRDHFFPTAIVTGYNIEDNPTAHIGQETFGHDFLLLDNRYVIDFWYNVVVGEGNAPILLDMKTQMDLVNKYYGNPEKWTPLGDSPQSKYDKEDPYKRYENNNQTMNYTNPNDADYTDKPEDWLATTLIMTKALGNILKENEGIVVELSGDMIEMFPTVNKVIVFNKEGMVHIVECEEDLLNGQMIIMD